MSIEQPYIGQVIPVPAIQKQDVMQLLYDLEINYGVRCFWDGGFDVWLGDEWNGMLEQSNVEKWHEVAPWLLEMAIEHYPGCRKTLMDARIAA